MPSCAKQGSLDDFGKWLIPAALPALFGVLGTSLVLARQATYGVALDWDSSYYISYASNLLAGEGLVAFDYGDHSLYPPLYTLLLAAFTALTGLTDPRDVAGPLNAVVFGMTVFVVGHYLHSRLQGRSVRPAPLLAMWASLAVALAISLAGQAAFALSEPLFILFATLALVCADRFIAEGQPKGRQSALIWAAVFSALAWQTRYVGVAVLLAVSLMLSVLPESMFRERLKHIAAYLFIAAVPMACWMLRNLLVGETPFGEREQIEYSLPAVIGEVGSRLWDWTQLGDGAQRIWPGAMPALPTAAVLAMVGGLVAVGWRVRRVPFDWRPALLFGVFAVVYFVLLVGAISSSYAVDGVQARYVTPLYIPLLLVVTFVLDWSLASPAESAAPPPRWLIAWRIASALLLIGGLVVSAVLNVRDIKSINLNGATGSLNPVLANWSVLDYVRQHLAGELLFSNAQVLMHLVTGQPNPARNLGLVVEEETHIAPGAYAVFVNWHRAKQLRQHSPFEAALLLEWSDLERVIEFPDGSIWYKPNSKPKTTLAHFIKNSAPSVNKPYQVGLASSCRRAEGRNPWRWEVGNWRQGWRPAKHRAGTTFLYWPTVEDIGQRLRASVYCIAGDGARIKVTTPVSLPVIEPVDFELIATTLFQPWLYGEPVARSVFDVYLHDRRLFYHKAPCVAPDIRAGFYLHIKPVAIDSLPPARRLYGFVNFDFDFHERGTIADGQCLGIFPLPAYAVSSVQTGQVSATGEELWRASISAGDI